MLRLEVSQTAAGVAAVAAASVERLLELLQTRTADVQGVTLALHLERTVLVVLPVSHLRLLMMDGELVLLVQLVALSATDLAGTPSQQ